MQPAASAGPSFHAAISSGKFQGMIWPQTPTGSRACRRRCSGALTGMTSALDLRRPAREVARGARRRCATSTALGELDRLAVVERLELRRARRRWRRSARRACAIAAPRSARRHRAPRRAVANAARAARRRVDVGGAGLRDARRSTRRSRGRASRSAPVGGATVRRRSAGGARRSRASADGGVRAGRQRVGAHGRQDDLQRLARGRRARRPRARRRAACDG